MFKPNGKANFGGRVKVFGVPAPVLAWIAVVFVLLILRKKITALVSGIFAVGNTTANIKDYQNNAASPTLVTSVNPAQIAQLCWDAIWGGLWGVTEDETQFLETLISCPKEYINRVAIEYAKIGGKGKNIYSDAIKYLSSSDYARVRYLLT